MNNKIAILITNFFFLLNDSNTTSDVLQELSEIRDIPNDEILLMCDNIDWEAVASKVFFLTDKLCFLLQNNFSLKANSNSFQEELP